MDLEVLKSTSFKDHFSSQFDSVISIGKGGFGQIYSAVSKVDLQNYAIKKMIVTTETFGKKKFKDALNELRILSKFDHKNIVRYHTAWFEKIDDSKHQDDSSESGSMTSNEISESLPNRMNTLSFNYSFESYGSDKCDSCFTENNEADIVFANSSNSYSHKKSGNSVKSNNENNEISNEAKESNNCEVINLAVYIQMELCEHNLKDWLNKRNAEPGSLLPLDKKNAQCLSYQLLKGVEYIHSKNIMHRDIKPANIFIKIEDTSSFQLKIGDFGLSKLFDYDVELVDGTDSLPNLKLSANIGTDLYRAPEIESISKHTNYNHKCDLYSTGIVLIELMVKFTTFSELFRVVTNMWNKIMLDELNETWPLEASYIMNLLSTDPKNRHEATFLLNIFKD